MSVSPQHGRRRAEPVRAQSRRRTSPGAHAAQGAHAAKGSHAASKVGASKVPAPAKRMAVVAVTAAVLAGGGLAQAATNDATNNMSAAGLVTGLGTAEAGAAPTAISAPSDLALDFTHIDVRSKASGKHSAANVQGEAGSVKPVPSPTATPSATPAPTPAQTKPVLVDDPAGAQAYASGQLAAHGWGADQMTCLMQLWTRESSWLTSAENASSGAYGIAQSLPAEKMASAGADYRTNYKTQINWGLSYIEGRYGSPCGAWGHSEATGWY